MPVYIPSRQANGIPHQRRKASAKQQTSYTGSQLQQPAQQKRYSANDPTMHRKDVEYILSLFVAEQLECERSVLLVSLAISSIDSAVDQTHQNSVIVYRKTTQTIRLKRVLNRALHTICF
jgi:hypothetical protein